MVCTSLDKSDCFVDIGHIKNIVSVSQKISCHMAYICKVVAK